MEVAKWQQATAPCWSSVQEAYIGAKSRYGYDAQLIGRVNQRIKQAADDQELVFYIINEQLKKAGIEVSELVEGLAVVSDHIFAKEQASIFTNSSFVDFLRENDIARLEVSGIDGNYCVAAAALDAARAGFAVRYPLPYIGSRNPQLFVKTRGKLQEAPVQIID
jgi:nicotinamidase-related amidase